MSCTILLIANICLDLHVNPPSAWDTLKSIIVGNCRFKKGLVTRTLKEANANRRKITNYT